MQCVGYFGPRFLGALSARP